MSRNEAGRRNEAARLRGAFTAGPLASRQFRLLSAGQLTSTVGDYCYAVALPWLILSTHGGPVLLGTVLACYGVPRTVLIPVGGILADKIGPRAIMLAADASRCVLVAALALTAARHLDSLASLGPVAALIGAGEGVFLPASFAIMPTLLRPDDLQAGNALSSAMVQVGSLAGPVLGGLLVTTAGPAPAFAVDAASFAVSAVALALIRTRGAAVLPAPQAQAAEPATQPDLAGEPDVAGEPDLAGEPDVAGEPVPAGVWSLLRHSRLLQTILLVAVVANLVFGGAFEVALPALAHARYGAAGYGALIACFGAGAVTGTLAAARRGGSRRPAIVACLGYLIGALAVCLVPYLGGLPGAAAAILIFGLCNGYGNIVLITLLQQWAPGHLLGRVMSLVMLASIGSFPASVAVSGVLVHRLGPSPFFPVAGVVLAIAIFGALTQRQFRDFGIPGRAQAELSPDPA
jgi:MFS family permease